MVEHEILLRGLLPEGNDPTILRRTDQDFIAAILAELTANKLPEMIDPALTNPDANSYPLKLYQPVHKTFYVALLDASCDFGGDPRVTPRVDPAWIEGAGLVVRRAITRDDLVVTGYEGWKRREASLLGWTKFEDIDEGDLDLDPDPDYRRPEKDYGHRVLNDLMNSGSSATSEVFSPLFVAPPEVAEATGRTILYGVIPVTSSESSEVPPELPAKWADGVGELIPPFLVEGSVENTTPEYRGRELTWKHATRDKELPSDWDDTCHKHLQEFINQLRMFVIGLDIFGDSEASKNLVRELNKIKFHIGGGNDKEAGKFLGEASEIFLDLKGKGDQNPPTIRMPYDWHDISKTDADNVKFAATKALENRMTQYSSAHKRFDDPSRGYSVRGFVRVRRNDICPPKTYWSESSELFGIAPWYETGEAPPARIDLPNVLDRSFLKKLKPNVAFAMPGSMYRTLGSMDPEELWKGNGAEEKEDLKFDWICGFNIPIITFCAFLILYLIINLLNWVFWWIPFVRICIPFPKKG